MVLMNSATCSQIRSESGDGSLTTISTFSPRYARTGLCGVQVGRASNDTSQGTGHDEGQKLIPLPLSLLPFAEGAQGC